MLVGQYNEYGYMLIDTETCETLTYNQMKQDLTNDPSVSYWLKSMIAELDAISRDPVDVLADIAILHKLQRLKVDELLRR